jgi:hypothetical protein
MTVLVATGRAYPRGIRVLRQQEGELARFARFCETHLRLEDGRAEEGGEVDAGRGPRALSPGDHTRRRMRRGRRLARLSGWC